MLFFTLKNTMPKKTFSSIKKKYRKTNEEMAKAMGISAMTYAKIDGLSIISVKKASKLASVIEKRETIRNLPKNIKKLLETIVGDFLTVIKTLIVDIALMIRDLAIIVAKISVYAYKTITEPRARWF